LQIGSVSIGHYSVLILPYNPVLLISVLLLCIIPLRVVETKTHSTGISLDYRPRA